jgi:hypothetical protein
MLNGEVSVVKALQDFFTHGQHGRKIEIAEFKELTDKDKHDLRDMLITEGYDVSPLKVA